MELNPNHGVTQEVREQWHKFCALAMFKLGVRRLEISAADIERFESAGLAGITVRPAGHVVTLELVTEAVARKLAKEEGGLPV